MTYNVSSGTLNSTIPIPASLFSIPGSNSERITRNSAVAERPLDAVFVCSQLQHTYSAVFLLLVTAASDLLEHKILLNSVLLSPIVSGGVRPKLPEKKGRRGRFKGKDRGGTAEEEKRGGSGKGRGRKREERVSPPNKNPGYGVLI